MMEASSWILDLSMKLDPNKDYACPRAVAICLEILRRMDAAEALQRLENRDKHEDDLWRYKGRLVERLSNAELTNSAHFHELIEIRDERWNADTLRRALGDPPTSNETDFPESFQITEAHMWAINRGEGPWPPIKDLSKQYSFGWTPIHYLNIVTGKHEARFGFVWGNPSEPDFRGWAHLHYACLEGNEPMVKMLLEDKADVNAVGGGGVTPMHCAAKGGHLGVVNMLMSPPPDRKGFVCEFNGGGKHRDYYEERAPIHWAAMEGHLDVAEALRDDINLKDRFGWTPLHLAALYGHEKVVEFCIRQAGTEKDQQDYEQRTPLQLAIGHKKDQAARVLLEAGASVNVATKNGITPLHIAARRSNNEIVQMLIDKKAEVNCTDNSNYIPLHFAIIWQNSQEVIRTLIAAGADVNATTNGHNTPLHMAAERPRKEIIQILLDNRADVNCTDDYNKTPLHHAIIMRNDEVIPMLIEAGANINAITRDDETPLHTAIWNSSKEIIRILLDNGAEVSGLSKTPLQVAVKRGDIEIVRVFAELDKKAENKAVVHKDDRGDTPLHALAECSSPESGEISVAMLRELLGIMEGIDINVRNFNGETPLDIARRKKCKELEDALLQQGAKTRKDAPINPDKELEETPPIDGSLKFSDESHRREQLSQDLFRFLREENGTFLVSGKAGSGKSTLMTSRLTFAAGDRIPWLPSQRCRSDALQEWAAGYKLVFVPLYFWSAGSQLQRSLEGFYRSLLSQVLGQCPEITQRLLEPTRSHLFRPTGASLPALANHPFRFSDLENAMHEITTMQHLAEYRMCFFIDGLDEYEGDVMDHLYLARYLRNWFQHPNIKILCSAHPHAEFLDTFSQSGKIIHIQNFTRADIYQFAYKMLENEQKPRPGPVELSNTDLSDLARRIVIFSEGVFLWVCLVVRSLGSKMGIYRMEQLFNLLSQTPRQLHKLYEGMLMRTDEAGRKRGDKMLVLALYAPSERLNAMAFSWLDEIDDPEFPRFIEVRELSEAEVQAQLDTVKRELKANVKKHQFLFYRYCVEPFHRTVKDFLVQDWFAEKTHAAALKLATREAYFKILLAELKSTVSMDYWYTKKSDCDCTPYFINILNRHINEFSSLKKGGKSFNDRSSKAIQIGDDLIEQYIPLIQAYQELLDQNGQGEFSALPAAGHSSFGASQQRQFSSTTRPSLVHLACHEYQTGYVLCRIDSCKHIEELDSPGKSLLLTAFYAGHDDVAKKVFDKGGSLNTKMEVKLYQYQPTEGASSGEFRKVPQIVSLWVVMLRILLLRICRLFYEDNYHGWSRPVDRMATILAEALRHGDKVDTDTVILVYYLGRDYELAMSEDLNYIGPIGTTEELEGLQYIELDQVLDLWILGDKKGKEENGASDISFLKECLVMPAQNYWGANLTKFWKGVPGWLTTGNSSSTSTSLADEARKKYPRADVNKLSQKAFAVYGVISSTERFVGHFWVALS
ncbi:hypothetical protein AAE478_005790 [Parahypoxylon ruwenzoriense]